MKKTEACEKSGRTFKEAGQRTNHRKACTGMPPDVCLFCKQNIAVRGLKLHVGVCNERDTVGPSNNIGCRYTGTRSRKRCEVCGAMIVANNMNRHHKEACPNLRVMPWGVKTKKKKKKKKKKKAGGFSDRSTNHWFRNISHTSKSSSKLGSLEAKTSSKERGVLGATTRHEL